MFEDCLKQIAYYENPDQVMPKLHHQLFFRLHSKINRFAPRLLFRTSPVFIFASRHSFQGGSSSLAGSINNSIKNPTLAFVERKAVTKIDVSIPQNIKSALAGIKFPRNAYLSIFVRYLEDSIGINVFRSAEYGKDLLENRPLEKSLEKEINSEPEMAVTLRTFMKESVPDKYISIDITTDENGKISSLSARYFK